MIHLIVSYWVNSWCILPCVIGYITLNKSVKHPLWLPVSIAKCVVPPEVVSLTIISNVPSLPIIHALPSTLPTSSMHLPTNTTDHGISSLPPSTSDDLTNVTGQSDVHQNSASLGLSPEWIAQVANMHVSSLQTDCIIVQKLVNALIQQGFICPSSTSTTSILSSTTPLD